MLLLPSNQPRGTRLEFGVAMILPIVGINSFDEAPRIFLEGVSPQALTREEPLTSV